MAGSETGKETCLREGNLRRMTEPARVVTFIGAGGKTTCMRVLTWELAAAGCPVIATTTTKVAPEEEMRSWQGLFPPTVEIGEGARFERLNPCFWYEETGEDGKWIGPSRQAVDEAIAAGYGYGDFTSEHSDYVSGNEHYWVIEGDGAKRLKLKCWANYEPQVPYRTGCGVLVTDGGLWGKILHREYVHRPEACDEIIGKIWNAENAWRYFLRSPVFYPEYRRLSWVILFNAPGLGLAEGEEILNAFRHCQKEINQRENKPEHLRLAAGDAKEGKLRWFDLW